MNNEVRIMIGDRLYYLNLWFANLFEEGKPENTIALSQLKDEQHYYVGYTDTNGRLSMNHESHQNMRFQIPKAIVEAGYEEESLYAENFNLRLAERYGIRLIDKQAMDELRQRPYIINNRPCPAINLGGSEIEIDLSMGELRNKNNPFDSVEIADLVRENGRYIVYVDAKGRLSEYDLTGYNRHELHDFVRLTPDEVSRVYGYEKDQLPRRDEDLRSHPDRIKQRLDYGSLPIIRIVDEDYYVDARLHELRKTTNFYKSVPLSNTHKDDRGRYFFLLNYLTREIDTVPRNITELPQHTVMVVVPELDRLDPIAAGRKMNNPMLLANELPIQNRMEALIVPLEKTWLPTLIEENKIALAKTNQERPKQRKGRRQGF